MAHIPELVEELEQTLTTDDTDTWVDKIIAVGVPAGPLLNYQQVWRPSTPMPGTWSSSTTIPSRAG
jgi:Predicted acyl-CoA transferases/carnitine dehydratase